MSQQPSYAFINGSTDLVILSRSQDRLWDAAEEHGWAVSCRQIEPHELEIDLERDGSTIHTGWTRSGTMYYANATRLLTPPVGMTWRHGMRPVRVTCLGPRDSDKLATVLTWIAMPEMAPATVVRPDVHVAVRVV